VLINLSNTKANIRLGIFGSYRTTESTADFVEIGSFKALCQRYASTGIFNSLELPPLTKESISTFIDFELDRIGGLPTYAVEWIYSESNGNPFLTKNILKILKENNIVFLD